MPRLTRCAHFGDAVMVEWMYPDGAFRINVWGEGYSGRLFMGLTGAAKIADQRDVEWEKEQTRMLARA